MLVEFILSLHLHRPCDFVGGNSYKCVTALTKKYHSHCDSGDLTILIFHVASRDDVFKGICDFIGGSSSW